MGVGVGQRDRQTDRATDRRTNGRITDGQANRIRDIDRDCVYMSVFIYVFVCIYVTKGHRFLAITFGTLFLALFCLFCLLVCLLLLLFFVFLFVCLFVFFLVQLLVCSVLKCNTAACNQSIDAILSCLHRSATSLVMLLSGHTVLVLERSQGNTKARVIIENVFYSMICMPAASG